MSGYRIRSVGPEDAEAWAALRAALWPTEDRDELLEEARRYFAGDSTVAVEVLVAEVETEADGPRGRTPVAMAELSIRPFVDGCLSRDVAYVEAWYVEPEHRARGVGRSLIEAAERWARGCGCTELASDTEVANTVSQRAHAACGFEETARVVQYRKEL